MNRQAYQEFESGLEAINKRHQQHLIDLEHAKNEEIVALWKELRVKYPDWDISLQRAFSSYKNNPLLVCID